MASTAAEAAAAKADELNALDFVVLNPAMENSISLKLTNARTAFGGLTILGGEVTSEYRAFEAGRTDAGTRPGLASSALVRGTPVTVNATTADGLSPAITKAERDARRAVDLSERRDCGR